MLTDRAFGYRLLPAQAQRPLKGQPFHRWLLPDGAEWLLFHQLPDESYLLRFPAMGDFIVSKAGDTIEAWPAVDISRDVIEHLFLNQVRPLVEAHRGKLVVHGSAVVLGHAAVAFVGASGDGKSTLASYLAIQGHPLVSDDGLTIDHLDQGMTVQAGHKSVRLWPDSLEVVLGNTGERVLPVHYSSKARIANDHRLTYTTGASRLQTLILLNGHEEDGPVKMERLSPTEALMSLLAHTFLLDHRLASQLTRQFEQLTVLIESCPVFRMHYPRRYECLPRVRETLLELHHRCGLSA